MNNNKNLVSNIGTPTPAKVTARLSNRGEKLSIAPRVRARVVCHTEHTHTGINNTSFSDHARVRARAIPDEFITAWRERIFTELGEDPVKVAVSEAIKDFGQEKDFTLWAWYANRIGVNNFLELYFEQKSIMRTSDLRNPAAAFHMRLKRFYAAMTGKEVAK